MIKKGMLVYNFDHLDKIEEINVGDYVQTIAALKIVNENWEDLIHINRENLKNDLNLKDDEKVKAIFNGWFVHDKETWPINKNVIPLFTSVHISKGFTFSENAISELKRFEPIGCRDLDSVKRLEQKGIKAYFSGCLTMSLPKREVDRKGILFVIDNIKTDFFGNGISTFKKGGINSFKQFKKWRGSKSIIKELKNYFTYKEIKNAEFCGQFTSKNLSIEEQFIFAEKWLDKLASKELIVTTRIHTLMPSMAMGTPSIFIMINNLDLRFKGLMDYWNIIDFSNNKKFNVDKHSTFYFKNKPISVKINRELEKIVNDESFRDFINPEVIKIRKWWNEQ